MSKPDSKCLACKREVPAEVVAEAIAAKKGLRCDPLKGGCGAKWRPTKKTKTADELASWFAEYHAENPHVYEAFKALAYEIRGEGHKRYGAKTILERIRWESAVRYRNSTLKFKLNNNIKDRCSARYARLLIAEDPVFQGFFEIRKTSTTQTRAKLSRAHRGDGGKPGF